MNAFIENYKKPTPVKWRKIGDYTLVIQAVLTANVPGLPIAETQKIWIMLALNIIGTTIKFWTNTKKA